MSGESPLRVSKTGCSIVRPQPASNKSVVESVVDFFSEVVPQAYSGCQKNDDKEKVLWVQFDQADVNDFVNNPTYSQGDNLPLLLTLGYCNGVQVWLILPSGEAQEVLSLRQGQTQVFKLLPNPQPASDLVVDRFVTKRPLVAVCDSSGAGQPYCSVRFMSLRTGEEAHNISFKNRVYDVQANRRIVVVTFLGKIAVFDACHFKERFCVTSCYPSPGPNLNPVALGDRWLAYADKKLVAVHQSGGGVTGNGGQSYAATVISAAEKVTKGLTMLGESVLSSVTGAKTSHHTAPLKSTNLANHPGVVTILDIERCTNEVKVQEDSDGKGLIAHFPAHVSEPVSAMEFNPSGMLLVTACALGHNFHVFHILAHPWTSSQAAVHHLYTLHRGDTTAKVQNMTFTFDSRWVAVSTLRGTTHVFPITPYGGPVGVRTHVGTKVVNRASRFHKSAGLDDIRRPSATKTGSPGSSAGHDPAPVMTHQNTILYNMGNPRLPPFPHPTTIHPLVQINRQPLSLPGVPSCQTKASSRQTGTTVESVHIAAQFGITRGWVAGMTPRGSSSDDVLMDSLYVAGFDGSLVEYVLEPRPKSGLDKVTDNSPIEVVVTPKAQWILQRSLTCAEMKPPLNDNNPLIAAHDAVILQQPTFTDITENPDLRYGSKDSLSSDQSGKSDVDDQWLSQVEIVTHAGPHRRLWMGPQFKFKTYQKEQNTTVIGSNSSSLLSHSPELAYCDLLCEENDLQSLSIQPEPARSNPVAMPGGKRTARGFTNDTYSPSTAPFIEAGSLEASPHLIEVYGSWPGSSSDSEEVLRETLADAMLEPRGDKNLAGDHHDSIDNLSSSSSSGHSASRTMGPDVRSSSPHVMLFPTNNGIV